MSPQPRFTIVIPTLNRAHCLGRAVDSALAQTYANLEVIVSNNGSRDNTAEVLAAYSDARLRVLQREQTIPATAHGNFLIAQASGELFLGLSDDDYLEPGFVEAVVRRFLEDAAVVMVYTRCWVHYWDVPVPSALAPEIETGVQFLRAYYQQQREVCWCACVLKTAELRRIGPIPEGTIFGDMYYWTQIAYDGKVGFVSGLLSHYVYLDINTPSASHSAPILEWGRETAMLADRVVQRFVADAMTPGEAASLSGRMRRYTANTVANQFVWLAIRGVRRSALWRAAWQCAGLIGLRPGFWPHVVMGLLAPRRLLAALARAMAVSRRTQALERENGRS